MITYRNRNAYAKVRANRIDFDYNKLKFVFITPFEHQRQNNMFLYFYKKI